MKSLSTLCASSTTESSFLRVMGSIKLHLSIKALHILMFKVLDLFQVSLVIHSCENIWKLQKGCNHGVYNWNIKQNTHIAKNSDHIYSESIPERHFDVLSEFFSHSLRYEPRMLLLPAHVCCRYVNFKVLIVKA